MGGDGKAEISLKRPAVHIFIDSFQVIVVLNLKDSIIYYCYELKTFADIPQALAKDHRHIEILRLNRLGISFAQNQQKYSRKVSA